MRTGSDRKTGRLTTDQKGSVMLEFVFAVSLLVVVFLAAVTFTLHFADYYGVQKVAAEGAREAGMTRDMDWARTRAYQAAWLWGLDPERLSVELYPDGSTVTCRVTYVSVPFHRTFPTLLKGKPLGEIVLSSGATTSYYEY
ncbi:MAG: pilus assembly protein [Peptococcaceae bacterium]|nr:pilus assembly protein [Peptococcaceae bacterium]